MNILLSIVNFELENAGWGKDSPEFLCMFNLRPVSRA